MKFSSTAAKTADGKWVLKHSSDDVGEITATADTREQALDKLRNEIRYRLELCPCTGETYQHIVVEISESA